MYIGNLITIRIYIPRTYAMNVSGTSLKLTSEQIREYRTIETACLY